ncbi:thioredoxin domain-containing protein [Agriterribacter sp.]|uniref:thioredoxin domain-containing protein n=1 Tax=Agriterribacter sp. TaxID=2821509 RepID=UPI002CECF5E1|nr:thioredoxin domain-containing protein [Agriterribacter sp.]HRO45627.1 thioredoxin domain-containing protein [Agriterribacter sp.]HRQ17448.1 thioredoxin domain-containing protein [Agriterribacter sp.]
MGVFTNHLIHETSPYLLQHAYNPVNWYPWNEEALKKAEKENKPILVSIGYAACHWCHVMERESFEDESVAAIMNEHFINIKIDREERPDLDHIYMNAVQTMTGSGGWPLNVFLTPSRKPFYGGTYFPPSPVSNRPSWQQVLQGVVNAFRDKRGEIESQAENLTGHLLQSNTFGITKPSGIENTTTGQFNTIFEHIMQSADTKDGGFGRAPKFPQTFTIQFLLRHFFYTQNEKALHQALLSLDKMIYGGIYDQLGGGFARYATDSKWLVPHFEKMLYDNALLVIVLSEAYQLTKNQLYADTIGHTMDFIERELMSEEGGFFSALDADSEGVEGKYYVWNKKEIESVLQEDAAVFCKYYGISEEGNWEHRNILSVLQPLDEFAAQHKLDKATIAATLHYCRTRLLEVRQKRVPPLLDDKILLSWNALMNMACSKAYAALGEERYKQSAQKNMAFLLRKFRDGHTGSWLHAYKNGVSRHPAFLDDYAFLVQALICLQEITGNRDYLLTSKQLMELIIDNFSEAETGFFFYTHRNQQDVILRIKEVYDGATPAGNSIMAWNLHYLSLVFDNAAWRARALAMCTSLNGVIVKYPTSFGMWAAITYDIFYGLNEIAVVGNRYKDVASDIAAHYLPNKVIQSAPGNDADFPLLTGRHVKDKTYIYLCRNYSCLQPVEKVADVIQLIEQERKR